MRTSSPFEGSVVSTTSTSRRSAERRQRGLLLDGRDSCPPPPEVLIEPFFKAQADRINSPEPPKEDVVDDKEHVYGQLWTSRTGKPRGRWSDSDVGSPERFPSRHPPSTATFTRRKATRIAQLLRSNDNLSANKKFTTNTAKSSKKQSNKTNPSS